MCSFRGFYANRGNGTEQLSSDAGPSGATRTRGFLLPKQAPYQLGYTRECGRIGRTGARPAVNALYRIPPRSASAFFAQNQRKAQLQ